MVRPAFDPATLPVYSVSGDPAIRACALSPDRLREYFRNPRTWQTEAGYEQRLPPGKDGPVPAAVLIPVVVRPDRLAAKSAIHEDPFRVSPGAPSAATRAVRPAPATTAPGSGCLSRHGSGG